MIFAVDLSDEALDAIYDLALPRETFYMVLDVENEGSLKREISRRFAEATLRVLESSTRVET